jgi:hypothetical protein
MGYVRVCVLLRCVLQVLQAKIGLRLKLRRVRAYCN